MFEDVTEYRSLRTLALEMLSKSLLMSKMIQALELVLSKFEREPDVWMLYMTMPCPDPNLHRLIGFCPDWLNTDIELEDKDISTLSAARRLANACKALDAHLKI